MYTIKIGRCLDYDFHYFYKPFLGMRTHCFGETHANISDMTLEWFVVYKFD